MKTLMVLGFLFFDTLISLDIVLTVMLIGLMGVNLWEKILNGLRKHREDENYELGKNEE